MSAQTVYEFRPSAARPAAVSTQPIISGNVIAISKSAAFPRQPEVDSSGTNRDGLNCARGLRAAFILEGGLGLLAYAIWHLIHFVR
ncbi:MAG TPA: hypothetical protein VGF82_19935 [Terracidiphilus sp.]